MLLQSFIEVKSCTMHAVKPAEALAPVVRYYLRQLPSARQWCFDTVSVYYDDQLS
jgi:hypothetical protein